MPNRQPTLPALQSVSQPDVIDDHLRFLEVMRRIKHGHHHQRMVGHDMAVAGIFVVAVVVLDLLAGIAPVRIGLVPRADIGNQLRDQAVARDLRETGVEQVIDIR